MYDYLDEAIYEGLVLEGAIATPYNVEENIRRGRMAMHHVILSHKIEPRAMYRKNIGWIGFEWGNPGNPPPDFTDKEEALKWWNGLNNKSSIFRSGYGISHIIAKRDWEGKWIKEFIGQKGIDVAYKLIEVIAKGKIREEPPYKIVSLDSYRAVLRRPSNKFKKEKRDVEWLLTGYKIETEGYKFILESAGDVVVSTAPIKSQSKELLRLATSTNLSTCGTHRQVGAANSGKIINGYPEGVNPGWLYDL